MPEQPSNPKRSAPLWLALAFILVFTWTVSAGSGTTVFLPVVSRQQPFTPTPTPTRTPTLIPPLPADYSVSYYIQTTSSLDAYNYGCALGRTDRDLPGVQNRLVILDFGQPWYENGQYGTIIFRVPPVTEFVFADIYTVKAVSQNYAAGYWNCTGSDTQSHLTLGIGTSNYLRADMQNADRARQHGQLWAQMVVEVNNWLVSSGYASQVYAAGANDMELFWATPTLTRAWVDGFNAYDNNSAIYYNYGACEGCPQSYYSSIGSWTGGVNYSWHIEDVWYITWGIQPAWAVPEIYLSTGANAKQWQTLSKYSAVQKGSRIDYSGVMTQSGACAQRGGCTFDTGDTANTPQEGWNQLWSYTYADPDTRMLALPWMTDIRYWVK